MFQELKVGFGHYMGRFFDQLVPTTKPMAEYCRRPFKYAVMLAPARMIDMAEDLLAKYLRADIQKDFGSNTRPHNLPVILVAFARDVTPTGRDYGRQVANADYMSFPDDEKRRVFKVRTVASDVRVQCAIFASDEPTARSIAAQFLLFVDAVENRRFWVDYEYAGFRVRYPAQLETTEALAPLTPTEANNLTVLAVDLTLKCTIPLISGPREGEPHDGKGIPGDEYDPAGYPIVEQMTIAGHPTGYENAVGEAPDRDDVE
jgi:hypothetical protein